MRILLAIGTVSVAVIVLWGITAPLPVAFGGASVELGPLLIDQSLLWRVLAVAVPVVGLASMVRVFRAAGGQPPAWRYRHRR